MQLVEFLKDYRGYQRGKYQLFAEVDAAFLEKSGVVRIVDSAKVEVEPLGENPTTKSLIKKNKNASKADPTSKSKSASREARKVYQREWVRNKRRRLAQAKP